MPQLEQNPNDEDLALLSTGIDEYNIQITGAPWEKHPLTFFIRDSDNKIIGGISGSYNGSGWLYIQGLWVDKKYRTRSFGSQLMASMEAEARKRGVSNSYLNTLSCQAPGFYKKMGYEVFAELKNYHQQHSRIYFRKKL